jgi:hypothetical protein
VAGNERQSLHGASLLRQFLDLFHGLLPTHVLLDGQAFERLDRGLRLQIALEDVDVVINALQALASDVVDAFQYFTGVDDRLRGCERLEVLAGCLRSTKMRLSTRSRKR